MELGRIPIYEGKVENDRADDDSDGTCVRASGDSCIWDLCTYVSSESSWSTGGDKGGEKKRMDIGSGAYLDAFGLGTKG